MSSQSENKVIYKVLVEFHRNNSNDFNAMYHYMDIKDVLNDMMYGDLSYLTEDPEIDIMISKGNFESFWGDREFYENE